MNSEIWGGVAEGAGIVTVEADVAASPLQTYSVSFQVQAGYQACHVASVMAAQWNSKYPNGPLAVAQGPCVHFAGTLQGLRVNTAPVPNSGASIAVPGLSGINAAQG